MDDDIEPTPECLAAYVHTHAQGDHLGVMGVVPVPLSPSTPPVMRYIHANFKHHLEKFAQPGCELQFRDFSTQNFSIRREDLLAVGAFDEAQFKIYGNEDLELSARLRAAGVRIVFNPAALGYQHYTKGFAALARDNLAKGRTAVLFATKHPDTFPKLKLSTYRQASRKWRLTRAVLLMLSRSWVRTPDLVILLIRWLEQRWPARMDLYYTVALDYFYWLGAGSALHTNWTARLGLTPPAKPRRESPT